MDPSFYWIIGFLLTGAILVGASFYGLSDKPKRQDHRSSTLLAAGVALVSFGVAIGAYYIKDGIDLRHEQTTASLNFVKSMLQFGMAAQQLDDISTHCYQNFQREACQESGAIAVKFSNSLPSVDFTFGQVARRGASLYDTNRLATYLISAEVTLRAQMPIIIEENVRKLVGASGQRAAGSDTLRDNIDAFRSKAEEIGIIYCLFAESSNDSWATFNRLVKKLDQLPAAMVSGAADQLNLTRHDAVGHKAGNVDCTKIEAAIEEVIRQGGGIRPSGGGN